MTTPQTQDCQTLLETSNSQKRDLLSMKMMIMMGCLKVWFCHLRKCQTMTISSIRTMIIRRAVTPCWMTHTAHTMKEEVRSRVNYKIRMWKIFCFITAHLPRHNQIRVKHLIIPRQMMA